MKRIKRWLSAVLSLTLLIGCGFMASALTEQQKRTLELLSRSSTKPIDELITTAYPQEELIEYLGLERPNFCACSFHLEEAYPPECVRTFADSATYCVYKLQEGGLVFVFLDEIDIDVDYVFVVKKCLTRDDFRWIQEGSTLADVEAVDPGAKLALSIHPEYLRIGGDGKIQSYHMVEGGFITIRYKDGVPDDRYDRSTYDDCQVTSIEFIPNGSLIGLHAVHYIDIDYLPYLYLEQDYAYIKQDELPAPLALLLPLTLLPLILFLRHRRNTETAIAQIKEERQGDEMVL